MTKKHSDELPGGWTRHNEADPNAARRRCVKTRRKDSARRRWALLNAFVDSGMGALKPADAVVWFALFRHAGPDGTATVARARLVKATGLHTQTVKTALARLVSGGWLSHEKRGGPNGGAASYRIIEGGEKCYPTG